MKHFFSFGKKTRRWRCKHPRFAQSASDRQERIRGWDQRRVMDAVGLLIGAGAANSWVGMGLTRKGYGKINIADKDWVEQTNFPRQFFRYPRDLYKNKALALCRNLSHEGVFGSTLIAHPCWYQELDLDAIKPDFMVCSVDMQMPSTRLEVCRDCYIRKIPCVFFAVSTDADYGYIFVQEPGEPGQACWACALKPELMNDQADDGRRCPGVPASIDIVMALAGHALYAVDSLIMDRPRDWNYRVVSLSRSDFGGSQTVPRRSDCPVCGGNVPRPRPRSRSIHDAKESP